MNDTADTTGSPSDIPGETPPVVRTATALDAALAPQRADDTLVGLVPTMGALHDGHLALVRRARRDCGVVVASLFVNPTQFGPGEDFERYPRDEAADLALFGEHGVDIVYAPDVTGMYPDGPEITVTVKGLTEGLCGAVRPGHFDGVTTAVSRLFDHCRPDVAYFGEKDYQQLRVIERMVADQGYGVRVIGVPVVRERDGLALSSRNAYLSPDERRIAPALFGTLFAVAGRLEEGADVAGQCEWGRLALLEAGFDSVDYFEARDAATLQPATAMRRGLRLFAAARLGATRLIDNISVDHPPLPGG